MKNAHITGMNKTWLRGLTAMCLALALLAGAGLFSLRADAAGWPGGKADLVDQITALNGELDPEALALLSYEELEDLLRAGAPDMPIGQNAALLAAVEAAGLSMEDFPSGWYFEEIDPELDERTPHYTVELIVDGLERDFGVHAFTGEVLEGLDVSSAMNPSPALPDDGAAAGTETVIGQDAALQTALDHAGLTQDQISRVRTEFTYKIEFRANGFEYEYTIDPVSGDILEVDRDD